MLTEAILNQYIHEHIPISQALGTHVKLASREKIVISAPFSSNINHKHTVFGGSLHAVATLSCWGLLYAHFIDHLNELDIVICRSEIDYLLPIANDFEAICLKPNELSWNKFINTFTRKRKSRIEMTSHIYHHDNLAVNYHGIFAVLKTCLPKTA